MTIRRLYPAILAGLALMLWGCVHSLHPLYTDNDLVFEPALVGEWTDPDGEETYQVEKADDKSYRLTCTGKSGDKADFELHLLKVGDQRFLDVYPKDVSKKLNDVAAMHLVPAHPFWRVDAIEPALTMSGLKAKWLEQTLEKTPDALRHETVDDTIIITAQPKELQAFLAKHLTTTAAWDDATSLTRKTAKP
jgi:hypothetical protein